MLLPSSWRFTVPIYAFSAFRLYGIRTYRMRLSLTAVCKTHGNTTVEDTTINAARCLHAFAAPEHIKVYSGAAAPLLRPVQYAPDIHGAGGLGGVEGLPPADSDSVRARIDNRRPAIEAIAAAICQTWNAGAGNKVTVVASGPLTNIALFVSVYPHLLDAVERIVFMGGGIGVGNRSAVAGEGRKGGFKNPFFFPRSSS
jgi:uridine nucleosidase